MDSHQHQFHQNIELSVFFVHYLNHQHLEIFVKYNPVRGDTENVKGIGCCHSTNIS